MLKACRAEEFGRLCGTYQMFNKYLMNEPGRSSPTKWGRKKYKGACGKKAEIFLFLPNFLAFNFNANLFF